ncbi:MAG: T9SS type A sorting domain-containing protein [Chitinophagaceae bacterium]|nr:T9SS type A sorting domain-containing protein [Chitinophagaceae bacterium]
MKNILNKTNILLLLLTLTASLANAQWWFDPLQYGDGTKRMTGYRLSAWDSNNLNWQDEDSSNYQYGSINKPMQVHQYAYNNAWYDNMIHKYIYDNAQRIIEKVDSSYTTPQVSTKYIYTYDVNGRLITKVRQILNTATLTWTNYTRQQYTYSASGKVSLELTEYVSNGIWTNYERLIYYQNTADKDSLTLGQKWNPSGSAWLTTGKSFYAYDANGNRISILEQNFDNTFMALVNYMTEIYTYDAQSKKTSTLRKLWNGNNNTWKNNYFERYTYNVQGLEDSTIRDNWDTISNNWVKSHIKTSAYQTQGWLISNTWYNWNTATNSYVNSNRHLFTHDTHGYLSNFHNEIFSSNLLSWQPYSNVNFWYEPNVATVISESDTEQFALSVYPVPSADGFTITMPKEYKKASIRVLDMTGKLHISMPQLKNCAAVQLGDRLPAGNYLIQTECDGKTYVNQVVKY